MPIYHPINDTIMTREQFLGTLGERRHYAAKPASPGSSSGNIRPFADIGPNLPMNMVLRRVYTGHYPEKHLFSDKKPMLLVSSLKDASTTSAGARAVNMLKQQVAPKSSFPGSAALDEGTCVLYYSPAVVSSLVTVTVELVFQDCDPNLFSLFSKLFTNLAGIPIFLPASGYLMGASTVVQLAGNLGQALLDGKPVLSESMHLDFSFGGGSIPVPGYWIFSANPLDLTNYKFDPDQGLLDNTTGKEYNGTEPYVAISIDGHKQEGLSNFTPLLATAGILGQFYNQKPESEVLTESLLSAVTLTNDLSYRKKLDTVGKQLSTLQKGTPEYVQVKTQYDALSANIQEPLLKPQAAVASAAA